VQDWKAALRISTSTPISFPGGEIRGFLHIVPEPQTFALVAIGIIAVALRRRRALSA